jgi:2'-5' RNA ligase
MSRNSLRRVRSFIAIELASGVKQRAHELIKQLKQTDADVRWVEPTEMHLTLKFLGEINRDEILPLCKITQEITAQFPPFDIGFSGLGAFPNADEPRTLWIGVEEGLEELTALHSALENALHKQLGFGKERRKFTPHLTIGRVNQSSAGLIATLDKLAEFASDFTDVDELVIFASFLDKQKTTYETLGHAVLGEMPVSNLDDDDDDDDDDDSLDEDDEFDDDDLEDEDFDDSEWDQFEDRK